jgi:hypothetical protein
MLTSYLQSAVRRKLGSLALRRRSFRLVLLKVNISFFPLTRHRGPLIVPERFVNDGVFMPNCKAGST